jgi:hypothetical protein
VVEYYPSAQSPSGMGVYFNPANVYVNSTDWVAGGRAFLAVLGGQVGSSADNLFNVSQDNEAVLVLRDGRQLPVQMPGYMVLAGTPDGWIMRSWVTGEAAVAQLVGDQVAILPLDTTTSMDWQVVGANFVLGAGADMTPFPATQPPAFTTCPGFMTSRLWPNTFAAITLGEPNNLRDAPSSTGALIGQIPGGEVIAVLNGPQCAENMAWWQVEYKGVTGWTSEGQGDKYWLETFGAAMY